MRRDLTEADWLEGRDLWRERHGREAEDPQLEEVRGWYIDGRRVHNPFASDAVLVERFDRWLADYTAEVERAAAARALEEAARMMPFPIDPYGGFDYESLRGAYVQITNVLHARAAEIREGGAVT